MTPITSDLEGYELFWSRMIWRLLIGLGLLLVPVYLALYAIWRK